jgi:hypothetical protein
MVAAARSAGIAADGGPCYWLRDAVVSKPICSAVDACEWSHKLDASAREVNNAWRTQHHCSALMKPKSAASVAPYSPVVHFRKFQNGYDSPWGASAHVSWNHIQLTLLQVHPLKDRKSANTTERISKAARYPNYLFNNYV